MQDQITTTAGVEGMGMDMWRGVSACLLSFVLFSTGQLRADTTASEDEIALALANMLRAGRTVIAAEQSVINDPGTDKGLTGRRVRDEAIRIYREKTGTDPDDIIAHNPNGKLLAIQIDSITEVLDDHQSTINKAGVGFKGFVPAVFARLVNERFRDKIGSEADVKVTAPVDLVRNRKALPDAWEVEVITSQLSSGDWPKDKVFSQLAEKNGRPAYRVLVPEYYSQNCLSCHGEPAGEIDITGYPKEGGHLGQLGGVISISLFR
jgi:hypothetical protein